MLYHGSHISSNKVYHRRCSAEHSLTVISPNSKNKTLCPVYTLSFSDWLSSNFSLLAFPENPNVPPIRNYFLIVSGRPCIKYEATIRIRRCSEFSEMKD